MFFIFSLDYLSFLVILIIYLFTFITFFLIYFILFWGGGGYVKNCQNTFDHSRNFLTLLEMPSAKREQILIDVW